mmetsp:Transcript_86843/g.177354  ORF Transcript_86843/g.177354 Transcript_86843/m.177354 type:complete len:90 (+) Transcript_86843:102-371(+)
MIRRPPVLFAHARAFCTVHSVQRLIPLDSGLGLECLGNGRHRKDEHAQHPHSEADGAPRLQATRVAEGVSQARTQEDDAQRDLDTGIHE